MDLPLFSIYTIMSEDTKTAPELNMDSFNPKKAELIALTEKHKAAIHIEIIDKETYEQVHSSQIVLRDTRNDIKNQWLAIRENANKFIKQVTAAEKELLALITPTEDILIAKKEEWKKKEDEKKELERKAQEELANNRNQELAKYGYVHDLFDLKIMEEEKFQELFSEKKTEWETVENTRISIERIEKRKNERISTLLSIGMFFNGIVYTSSEVPSIGISMESVEIGEDDLFAQTVDGFKIMIETARENIKKAKDEQDKRDFDLKAREDAIKAKEDEQKRIDDEKKKQQELEDTRKQAEKDTENRIKKEQSDKEAREKALADQKAEEEIQEQIKMARLKKYKKFCESIGYKKEEDHLWITNDVPEGREFYKKVDTYLK